MKSVSLLIAALLILWAAVPPSAHACSGAESLNNTIVGSADGEALPSNAVFWVRSASSVGSVECAATSDHYELIHVATDEPVEVTWTSREVVDTTLHALAQDFLLWEGTPSTHLAAGDYALRIADIALCSSSSEMVEAVFTVEDVMDTEAPATPVVGDLTSTCEFRDDRDSCTIRPIPHWRHEVGVEWSATDADLYEVFVDGELEYVGTSPGFVIRRLDEVPEATVEIRGVDHAGNRSEMTTLSVLESCDTGEVDGASGCSVSTNSDAPAIFALALAALVLVRRRR